MEKEKKTREWGKNKPVKNLEKLQKGGQRLEIEREWLNEMREVKKKNMSMSVEMNDWCAVENWQRKCNKSPVNETVSPRCAEDSFYSEPKKKMNDKVALVFFRPGYAHAERFFFFCPQSTIDDLFFDQNRWFITK